MQDPAAVSSPTLAEFLLARLAETEQVARSAQTEPLSGEVCQLWEVQDWVELDIEVLAHVNRHDPARVLAEVAAQRRIIAAYGEACVNPSGEMRDYGHEEGLEEAMRLLALPHAAHPDYRPEWAP